MTSTTTTYSAANATPSTFVLAIAIIAASVCISRRHYAPSIADDDDQPHQQQQQQQGLILDYEARIAKLEETRRAERTGRIRAEMRLRSLLKSISGNSQLIDEAERDDDGGHCHFDDDVTTSKLQKDDNANRSGSKINNNNTSPTKHPRIQQEQHLLQLQTIGTIVSPYTKRMGTPRQGALVPSGRGYVQLTTIPMECLEGMESYSHAWIIFSFHANTDINTNTNNDGNNTRRMIPLSKTKIRPPRGNGIKVGMLATRSPHRPNNIGLSLVRVSHLDMKHKRLHITALDLVHGTPVYDIKPVVPWDIPGQYDSIPLDVPSYVSHDEDTIDNVEFTTKARESLEICLRNGKLGPLYTAENNGLEEAIETICQILAQDPRASNSNGPNKRGSTSTSPSTTLGTATSTCSSSTYYKMLFCSVEIEFQVHNNNDDDKNGVRGVVVTVENVNGDLDLTSMDYVDGIPILLK